MKESVRFHATVWVGDGVFRERALPAFLTMPVNAQRDAVLSTLH
jgi:hypothetical protein